MQTSDLASLDEIAHKWGTDKRSGKHGYTRAYEEHFGPLRHRPVRVAEAGIWEGASVGLLTEYFDNPESEFWFIDIDLGPYNNPILDSRAHIIAADMRTWEAPPWCDIIIDDGSHVWSHQNAFFNNNWKHVAPGGYYVIEDLNTSYADRWGIQYADSLQSGVGLVKNLVDRVNLYGYPTHADEVPDSERVYPLDVAELHLYPYVALARKWAKPPQGVQAR